MEPKGEVTMNECVKQLRKELKLNQSDFGKRLGVTPAAISKIEKGERKLTVQMAKAICNEFRVNQEWLVYGTGEMFQEFPTTLLDQLSAEFDLDDMEKQLVKDFITLDKEQRQMITKFLRGSINQ